MLSSEWSDKSMTDFLGIAFSILWMRSYYYKLPKVNHNHLIVIWEEFCTFYDDFESGILAAQLQILHSTVTWQEKDVLSVTDVAEALKKVPGARIPLNEVIDTLYETLEGFKLTKLQYCKLQNSNVYIQFILQTRRHVPTCAHPSGGHNVKVRGHCKKIFPALRAGERVPPHF